MFDSDIHTHRRGASQVYVICQALQRHPLSRGPRSAAACLLYHARQCAPRLPPAPAPHPARGRQAAPARGRQAALLDHHLRDLHHLRHHQAHQVQPSRLVPLPPRHHRRYLHPSPTKTRRRVASCSHVSIARGAKAPQPSCHPAERKAYPLPPSILAQLAQRPNLVQRRRLLAQLALLGTGADEQAPKEPPTSWLLLMSTSPATPRAQSWSPDPRRLAGLPRPRSV